MTLRKMRHGKNTNPNLTQKEYEKICDEIQEELRKIKRKEEILEKKLDLSSSDIIPHLKLITQSIDNLSTQINLLREDLRPERRKSEIFKGEYMTEKEERERIKNSNSLGWKD